LAVGLFAVAGSHAQADAAKVTGSRIKRAALATIMYTNDYDDYYPPTRNNEAAISACLPFGGSRTTFECPTGKGDFLFNLDLSGQSGNMPNAAQVFMWVEPPSYQASEMWAAFADGHANRVSPSNVRGRFEVKSGRKGP
jgi:hypothetical protein